MWPEGPAGEFEGIVGEISGRLAEGQPDRGIHPKDIAGVVRAAAGPDVNCYPGAPTSVCHPVAFFIAMKGTPGAKRGHLDMHEALGHLERHIINCPATRHAVVILAGWDPKVYADHRHSLIALSGQCQIEIYLHNPGRPLRIPIG